MKLQKLTEDQYSDIGMRELFLSKDGTLVFYQWDNGVNREYIPKDISDDFLPSLDRLILIEDGVTLKTIFDLVAKNNYHVLDLTMQNCFIHSFITYYKNMDKRVIKKYKNTQNPNDIEFLELYWHFSKNSTTKEFFGFDRPGFHGFGFLAQKDVYDDYGNIISYGGNRIPFAIEFAPIKDLLNIPIKINEKGNVYEDDHSLNNHNVIEVLNVKLTLRDLINGIFWELSFCGGPHDNGDIEDE